MKRVIAVFMLVLTVCITMPAFAQDRVDSKIRFNDLYGEVSIRPNYEEDDAYEYAELDTIIYENDRIRTKEESGAILGLEDMSTFVIKPESILVIHGEEGDTSKMEMLAGRIMGNVKKMREGKTIGFEMSQCVAGIKGTAFDLSVSKDGQSNTVRVMRGTVVVTSKVNAAVYDVNAGESLTINNKGQVATSTIDADKSMKNMLDDVQKMNEKMNDNSLLEDLNEKTSFIRENNEELSTELKNIRLAIADNKDVKAEKEAIKLKCDRFSGAIEEARALIITANKKINQQNIGSEFVRPVMGAIDSLNNVCKEFELIAGEIDNLTKKEKQEQQNQKSASEKNEDLEAMLTLISNINNELSGVSSNARTVMEGVQEGNSYESFVNSRLELEGLSRDLSEISDSVKKIIVTDSISNKYSELTRKLASVNTFVNKSIKDLSSVAEISSSLLMNIKDIRSIITDYSAQLKSKLNDYAAIERSSPDAKKRYVESMAKVLTACDRIRRQFTKAQRMHNSVVKSFASSKYKTAEYEDEAAEWQEIQDAMASFADKSEILKENVDRLKNQLEEAMGVR